MSEILAWSQLRDAEFKTIKYRELTKLAEMLDTYPLISYDERRAFLRAFEKTDVLGEGFAQETMRLIENAAGKQQGREYERKHHQNAAHTTPSTQNHNEWKTRLRKAAKLRG